MNDGMVDAFELGSPPSMDYLNNMGSSAAYSSSVIYHQQAVGSKKIAKIGANVPPVASNQQYMGEEDIISSEGELETGRSCRRKNVHE